MSCQRRCFIGEGAVAGPGDRGCDGAGDGGDNVNSIVALRGSNLSIDTSLSRISFKGIFSMAIATTLILHSGPTTAYSFLPSRHQNVLQRYKGRVLRHRHLQQQQNPTQRTQRNTLVMKRPRNQNPTPSIPTEPSTELPANLKRHVVAKRPTLGHVVPKKSFTRQLRQQDDQVGGQRHNRSNSKGGSNTAQLRPQGQSRDTLRYNNPSNLRILGGSIRGRKLESPSVYLRPMMGKVKEAVFSTFASFGLYDDDGREAGSCKTRHLDIFSGSGSVGLESLSRGARHCTFVDMSPDCCATAQRNVERCGFDGWVEAGLGAGFGEAATNEESVVSFETSDIGEVGKSFETSHEGQEAGMETIAKVVCTDAYRALLHPQTVGINPNLKYDIVTLCPPYEEIVYADLIHAVANSELVGEDTVILIEYPVELGSLPHVVGREDGGVLVGIRNRKYGRTVIAMYIVDPTGLRESAESRPEEFVTL